MIDVAVQDVLMIGFVIVLLLVIVGPLAVIAGVDSRIDEASRRRLGH